MPRSSAGTNSSQQASTKPERSHTRSGYFSVPCWMRVSESSCSMSVFILLPCCSMTLMEARKSSFVSALRLARSHSARITATGVRSSCDASAVNCFLERNDVSSRANIPSNVRASRRISRGPRRRSSRAERSSPSEMLPAASVMRSSGRNESRAMSQPPPIESRSSTGSSDHVSGSMTRPGPAAASAEMTPRTQSPVIVIST